MMLINTPLFQFETIEKRQEEEAKKLNWPKINVYFVIKFVLLKYFLP